MRDLAGGLALGISGAGQELSETPALECHGLAAILAGFRFGFGCGFTFLGRLLERDFLRVLALGICRTREETSELSPLLDHRAAALLADLVGG